MKTLGTMFILFAVIRAEVLMLGKCLQLPVQNLFYPNAYLGKWYLVEEYFTGLELKGKCITETYIPDTASGSLTVTNNQINIKTNQHTFIKGIANFPEGSNVGKFTIAFPSTSFDPITQFSVLDTDYDSYAVVYSCKDFIVFHTENVWILSRSQFPSQAIMNQAHNIVARNGFQTSRLAFIDQLHCPVVKSTAPYR